MSVSDEKLREWTRTLTPGQAALCAELLRLRADLRPQTRPRRGSRKPRIVPRPTRIKTFYRLPNAAALLGMTTFELRALLERDGVTMLQLGPSVQGAQVPGWWVAKAADDLSLDIEYKPGSQVYFIRCREFVKIGIAADVHKRLAALRSGCPYELELLGTVEGGRHRERRLHTVLHSEWHHGEWFRFDSKLRRVLRLLRHHGADVKVV